MFNPFREVAESGSVDAELVEQAKNGDRAALEKLILRHQAWVYNIAVRMVFRPHDAEEVTQEVLIKVITKLSTFKGESKFRTWLYRIAANHVLNMKRRRAENQVTTFAAYGAAIESTPDLDLPDPKNVPVALPLLVEEAKNGYVDPHHLLFVSEHVQRVRDVAPTLVHEVEDVVERQHAAIYGDHPFLQPADQVGWFRRLLENEAVRGALYLN